MIDTIHLKTDSEFNYEAFKNNYKAGESLHTDRQYRVCRILHVEGSGKIIVKQKPFYSKSAQTVIQSRLSVLADNIIDLKKTFKKATNFNEIAISRVDHYVDYPEPIDLLHDNLRWHRKRSNVKYLTPEVSEISSSGQLRGYYVADYPEMILIYDKAYEFVKKNKLKKIKGTQEAVLTRLEVRHKNKKIAHSHLRDLEEYLYTPVFPKCSRMVLCEDEVSSKKDLLKIYEIKKLSKKLGLTGTISFLNRQGNFNRGYAHLFKNTDFQDELNNLYWLNLSQYFESQQVGKYAN